MTRAQDLARQVNTPLSILHHFWAETVLNIPYKPGSGFDLYDPKSGIGIEIKFSKVEEEKNRLTWTVNRQQLAYLHQCDHFFWGCGIHYPSQPIHTMSRFTTTTLERKISFRELYLVEPTWVQKTVAFRLTEGKSRTKEWSSYLGYASFAKLPPITCSYSVRRGFLHLTEGVPEELFHIEGKKI